MKKIIGVVLATIIMLSTLGILPASADYLLGGTYEYADRNECEEKYNISYYTFAVDYDDNTDGKITSVQELTDVFSNDEEILSKYDEEFFQDKFLYRIGHNAGDTSYSIRVTAVSSEKGSVEILLSLIQEDKGGDMVVVPWTALVELDRSLIDQNVLIKEVPFSYSYAAGISYYNQINLFEYDEWNYLEDPVPENRRKLIKSYAELTSFIESATYLPTYDEVYQGVISNYDDDFFEDKFLLFVNWKYCDGSSLDFGIAYDRKNGDLTSIKIAEVEKPSDSSVVDMECDWLIVLELDSSLLDEEFNLTMQTERGNEVGILSYPQSGKSFDEQYNISYYTDSSYYGDDTECKITTYEELQNKFSFCEEIKSKYDEAFFENKFLYRIGYKALDTSYSIGVTGVDATDDLISIELEVTDNEEIALDMVVPWDIILEFDKAYLDIPVVSKITQDWYAYTVYDESFGKGDAAFVKVTYYPNDKTITVGDSELYYNSKKGAYFGLVDASGIGEAKQSVKITTITGTPTTFTYGNLDDDDAIDGADLQIMKLAIKGSKALEGKYLIASDVDGDGLCDGVDLQELKLKIKNNREFSVLQ